MTKNFTYIQKTTGDTLSAAEWNNLAQDVDAAVDAINNGNSEYVNITSKGNLEIASPKNINIEPASDSTNNIYGDISFKPGDDIELLSDHRPSDKQDEISLKIHDANKKPVKLQVNVGEITLNTKDKVGDNAAVLDININSAKNTKGYLKVRAQAIDLRCEDHGGIALQPKGEDSDHNMNKIKFEHGGGDGLEFGTFNTEKSSLFTGEYRFNKNGTIKLATRTTTTSDKYDEVDETTHYKYVKQADDFYDVIDQNDPTCTWEDIVKYIAWAKANNQGPWAV